LLLVDARDTLHHCFSVFCGLLWVLTASSDFKPSAGLSGRKKPLATHTFDPRQRFWYRFCLPASLPRVLPTVALAAMLLYLLYLPADISTFSTL
jgi:hypothetical protein